MIKYIHVLTNGQNLAKSKTPDVAHLLVKQHYVIFFK